VRYLIEYRIATIIAAAVTQDDRQISPSFSIDLMTFSPWDATAATDVWGSQRYWLASTVVEATDYREAYSMSWRRLARIGPRIALVTQAYIDVQGQPYLIVHDGGASLGYFTYMADRPGVGLMFMDDQLRALAKLLDEPTVPEEFYYYWNDAVNAVGYTAKLLLMFSAIEVLTKPQGDGEEENPRRRQRRKDWSKVRQVLGDELTTAMFGTAEASWDGLRHRLTHGEYLGRQDAGMNYLERIHKQVMGYFNREILGASLIAENVISPQRHPWGGKKGGQWFIQTRDRRPLSLRAAVEDFSTKAGPSQHVIVSPPPSEY